MSIKNWPGGVISDVPPTPSGPYENSTASGVWTLEQQAYWEAQGLWPTAGAVNPSVFIENLFQTWLYTGNGSTQTINNGIDLAGEGGLVWVKPRSVVGNNTLYDTARGVSKALISNSAVPEQDYSGNGVTSFNSNGFAVTDSGPYAINDTGTTYVSWAFREQPKFFDIVTYTGNQAVGHNIPHNLGSTPGLIIVKAYDGDNRNWFIYHRSLGATKHLVFTTAAETVQTDIWNDTEPTSTQFTVGDSSNVNQSGRPYIAYLFAHNAGGFGPTESDNVISCGSFTCPSSGGVDVNLGYEPQWILTKKVSGAENWNTWDTMRGWALTNQAFLAPNNSNAEVTFSGTDYFYPTATGFRLNSSFGLIGDYIYIAIRRGPMKVPTTGTSVFAPVASNASTGTTLTTNFPVDLQMAALRPGNASNTTFSTRLTGINSQNTAVLTPYLVSSSTAAETTGSVTRYWINDSFQMPGAFAGTDTIFWNFRRAPSVFDEVCYTGTGSARTVAHNLTVVPELMIIKARIAGGYDWMVYQKDLGNTLLLKLNETGTGTNRAAFLNSTTPTASVFTVGTDDLTNVSGGTFVSYLFASVPGVSRVGSYTGNGGSQTINCGFTAGSRFVMIKRADAAGDWYVWDSARGIVAGNDPYLLLNSQDAEVTNTDFVDTAATGFEISSTAPAAINASGGTFIFLAIA